MQIPSAANKMPATSIITFEQPLNERTRTFMRVEQLFARCKFFAEKDSAWDSHFALTTLLELIGLASRGDLKRELISIIYRSCSAWSAWSIIGKGWCFEFSLFGPL